MARTLRFLAWVALLLPVAAPADDAEALQPKLVELRRDLHRHPELAFHEERTARLVADHLRALGFDEVRTNVAKTGVVGLLKGGRPGPVVAVRADMDALPITETNAQPYCSTTPGAMHACGHDAHTAIALGVAEVLSRRRSELRGSVKFLFQPAEESAGDGALENPRPQALFGLHTSPELQAGLVGYHSGPAQAAIDTFTITVRGKTAGGTSPQLGVDTIVVAAECVTALQTIRSRRLSPTEMAVITVGMIQGGERPFSTPAEVKLRGSYRILKPYPRGSQASDNGSPPATRGS